MTALLDRFVARALDAGGRVGAGARVGWERGPVELAGAEVSTLPLETVGAA